LRDSTLDGLAMKLAAYVRVSPDAEVERGRGTGVQKKAITRWAKTHRHRVAVWTADEGVSGADGVDTRVGLYEALEAARSGKVGGLVIYDLDCLARALHVQEAALVQVWEAGGKVFSVADRGEVPRDDPHDPMRTAMRQVCGVFALLERSMLQKRLIDARRAKAERGGYPGGIPPFGWRLEGENLVEDPAEQHVVARMLALWAEGGSTRSIADALNAEGVPTKQGKQWSNVRVWHVLKRELARRPHSVRRAAASPERVARQGKRGATRPS
jgi:DNA invertase Pin-like site-specific DNA recombinase